MSLSYFLYSLALSSVSLIAMLSLEEGNVSFGFNNEGHNQIVSYRLGSISAVIPLKFPNIPIYPLMIQYYIIFGARELNSLE